MTDPASGRWVYGVVPAASADPPGGPGIDGHHPVELVRCGELAAVTSEVPLDTYGEEALRENLEDLAYVEELARGHERVVEEAHALAGTLVPFRLCTIYTGTEQVRDMLRREQATLAVALERVRGTAEWGVKAYARPAADLAVASARPASGAAYLQGRLAARDAEESAWDELGRAVERVHAELAGASVGAALGRPQDKRLSGRDDEMVLNAAYLVPDEEADAFRARVAVMAAGHVADGLELELTGPWPPYHFAAGAPE